MKYIKMQFINYIKLTMFAKFAVINEKQNCHDIGKNKDIHLLCFERIFYKLIFLDKRFYY